MPAAATNDSSPSRAPILIVDLSRGFGGVDVRVLAMARALRGRRPFHVATMAGSPLHQRLADEGLPLLAFTGNKYDPRLLYHLFRAIQREKYAVVDAHNFQSQWWGLLAAKLAGVPRLISSVHTAYGTAVPWPLNQFQAAVLKANIRWNARFITVSTSILNYLHAIGAPAERAHLIYNGIDLDAYGDQAHSGDLRREFGWPPDAHLVVVVGRLEWQKGHDFLIKALPAAIARCPQIRCVFVGDGRLHDALAAQAQSAALDNHLAFAGFRADIAAILAQADLFCLPSRTEGLPFAVLEAVAQNVPLLLSDVDGMGELFTHNETAYLVPSGDIAALTAGLVWSAGNGGDAQALAQRARAFVAASLSPEKMIAETLAVYDH